MWRSCSVAKVSIATSFLCLAALVLAFLGPASIGDAYTRDLGDDVLAYGTILSALAFFTAVAFCLRGGTSAAVEKLALAISGINLSAYLAVLLMIYAAYGNCRDGMC